MPWCLCEPAVVDCSAVCGQHYKANAFLVQVPRHTVHNGSNVAALPAGALKCNVRVRGARPKSGAMKQSAFHPPSYKRPTNQKCIRRAQQRRSEVGNFSVVGTGFVCAPGRMGLLRCLNAICERQAFATCNGID